MEPGPITAGERIRALDVARGVAIVGILPVNLIAFFLPLSGVEHPAFAAPGRSEEVAYFLLQSLFVFKFISVFSLLYGVGIALQFGRAQARQHPFALRFLWRSALLLGIGLVHALGFWYGDILCWYAVLGLVAAVAVEARPRWQIALGFACLGVPIALCVSVGTVGLLLGDEAEIVQQVKQAFEAEEFPTLADALSDPGAETTPLWDLHPGRETLVYREGSWSEIFALRALTWALVLLVGGLLLGWHVLGLFLVGMGLHGAGLFTEPDRHRRTLRRVIGAGVCLGLPIECLRARVMAGDGISLGARVLLEGAHHLAAILLALGILAATVLWVQRGEGPLRASLAAVGRTALSNYLFQTLVATTLSYSYGFALFGWLNRTELFVLGGALVSFQLLISRQWVRRYRFGPVEWLWRSATWARLQPWRVGR